MATDIRLGRVDDLEISMAPAGLVGTLFNVVLFTALGRLVFRRSMPRAIAGGMTLAGVHWWLEIWHNVGHARAARMTGHPMTGVRLGTPYLVLGTSIYPDEEGELPARVHITRALGGPISSAVLSVATGFIAVVTAPFGFGWVALLAFLDNLTVFTIGAWVPVGFNDVSTIVYWMKRR